MNRRGPVEAGLPVGSGHPARSAARITSDPTKVKIWAAGVTGSGDPVKRWAPTP
jgi:hypothetical protein